MSELEEHQEVLAEYRAANDFGAIDAGLVARLDRVLLRAELWMTLVDDEPETHPTPDGGLAATLYSSRNRAPAALRSHLVPACEAELWAELRAVGVTRVAIDPPVLNLEVTPSDIGRLARGLMYDERGDLVIDERIDHGPWRPNSFQAQLLRVAMMHTPEVKKLHLAVMRPGPEHALRVIALDGGAQAGAQVVERFRDGLLAAAALADNVDVAGFVTAERGVVADLDLDGYRLHAANHFSRGSERG